MAVRHKHHNASNRVKSVRPARLKKEAHQHPRANPKRKARAGAVSITFQRPSENNHLHCLVVTAIMQSTLNSCKKTLCRHSISK